MIGIKKKAELFCGDRLFYLQGDWDAEKVIDIPNKKVIELRKKCKDFMFVVQSDRFMFIF